ncbi:MAG TPA: hypothetical protein VN641_20135 [Urbifossiella sp.]|nr:hypothetical protein [Urbifossiella sp.]
MTNEPEHPDAFERRDVDVSNIVLTAILFALTVCLLLLALWGLCVVAVPESNVGGASPPVQSPGETPVGERVRMLPPPHLEGLGTSETTELTPPNNYGWVDEKKGIARIPVEAAMDAVVESSRKKGGGQ